MRVFRPRSNRPAELQTRMHNTHPNTWKLLLLWFVYDLGGNGAPEEELWCAEDCDDDWANASTTLRDDPDHRDIVPGEETPRQDTVTVLN